MSSNADGTNSHEPKQGNTKPVYKARNITLTVNPASLPFYTQISAYLRRSKQLVYYKACEHFGQTNQHYHVFALYRNNVPIKIEELHGSHIEEVKDVQHCVAYIEGCDSSHANIPNFRSVTVEEFGEKPDAALWHSDIFKKWLRLTQMVRKTSPQNQILQREKNGIVNWFWDSSGLFEDVETITRGRQSSKLTFQNNKAIIDLKKPMMQRLTIYINGGSNLTYKTFEETLNEAKKYFSYIYILCPLHPAFVWNGRDATSLNDHVWHARYIAVKKPKDWDKHLPWEDYDEAQWDEIYIKDSRGLR